MNTTPRKLVSIQSAEQYRALAFADGLPVFDSGLLDRHRPDAHWAVVESNRVVARCSLWWRSTPAHAQHRLGFIGHFASSSDDSASEILQLACRELAAADVTLAIGPIDGNTWRDYRLVTWTDGSPRFFMEPNNPDAWPAQFRRHGFTDFAHYFSAQVEDLSVTSPRVERAWHRIRQRGVSIRPVEAASFEEDMRDIHAVASVAFRHHLLYQSMTQAEFLRQYETLRSVIPLDLVLLAKQHGRPVGFGFGVPDLLQADRGEPIDTVVIKTLAVLPEPGLAGLGQVLLEQLQQRAATMGFRRGIQALVSEVEHLQRISQRHGAAFRRYTLFAKEMC